MWDYPAAYTIMCQSGWMDRYHCDNCWTSQQQQNRFYASTVFRMNMLLLFYGSCYFSISCLRPFGKGFQWKLACMMAHKNELSICVTLTMTVFFLWQTTWKLRAGRTEKGFNVETSSLFKNVKSGEGIIYQKKRITMWNWMNFGSSKEIFMNTG